MGKVQLLNIYVENYTLNELLENYYCGILMPVNVDVLMQLHKNEAFHDAVMSANDDIILINDSQIIRFLFKLLWPGIDLYKVSGSDFLPVFCEHHAKDETVTVFLLGAGPCVAEKAAENINGRVGRRIVIGTHSPSFGFERNPDECALIVKKINESGATVLAVGVGCPKQEKWIFSHRERLINVKMFMAVGATIDFQAGVKKRSPKWVSDIGLEWLHRLVSEPRRLCKRYLINDIPFLWLILKQRLGLYPRPGENE